MKSLVTIFKNIEEILSGTMFIVMTLITFINVISRYFFNVTFAWPEELSRYCFIWMTFLGAALCTKQNRHIIIDFLVLKTTGKPRGVITFVSDIAVIILMVILIYYGWKLAINTKLETATLHISKSWILYVVPFSALLILIRTFFKVGNTVISIFTWSKAQ